MEIWKNIDDANLNHQISSLGNVRNAKTLKNLSKHPDKKGYLKTTLWFKGYHKTIRIHREVSNSFIENPFNKPYVNHKNGIKNDNRIENLEWVTASENMQHAYASGIHLRMTGEKHPSAILTETDVINIRNSNLSNKELSLIYPLPLRSIRDVRNSRSWKHLPPKITFNT